MRKQKKRKGKYEYDVIEDALYFFPVRRTYSSSFKVGNLIFDLDAKKKIVGLEILFASKVLGMPKFFLKNISNGLLELNAREKNKIHIRLELGGIYRNQHMKDVLDVEKRLENNFEPSSINLATVDAFEPHMPLPQ